MAKRMCGIEGCDNRFYARGWCNKHYQRWYFHGDPLHKRATPEDRFWKRVPTRDPDVCWEWSGSLTPNGYSQFSIGYQPISGHRFSYELHKGPIPDGLQIDHLCRNRACVNPAHLEAVTPLVNTMRAPGTISTLNARKTHCHRGHEFSEANTRVRPDGARACRTCEREGRARRRERAAAKT